MVGGKATKPKGNDMAVSPSAGAFLDHTAARQGSPWCACVEDKGDTHVESQQSPVRIAAPGPSAQILMGCVEQHEGRWQHGCL